ncbi:hypothetical protein IE81DRAFT_362792 [Ceraceosorus guamensis]|uniref:Uncharacterized protein n=1 Tax=Ceraceosorus guamensis TaxID=1522189 RepID=A0A316W4H1_9BASI|nr:hypothetical protein IE81DRAFT_362792 [Ceraceosorus guamensis]PWN44760.1 hypothetical protein IE81DRAFT_362792 [Ceraceosorus guamensis]
MSSSSGSTGRTFAKHGMPSAEDTGCKVANEPVSDDVSGTPNRQREPMSSSGHPQLTPAKGQKTELTPMRRLLKTLPPRLSTPQGPLPQPPPAPAQPSTERHLTPTYSFRGGRKAGHTPPTSLHVPKTPCSKALPSTTQSPRLIPFSPQQLGLRPIVLRRYTQTGTKEVDSSATITDKPLPTYVNGEAELDVGATDKMLYYPSTSPHDSQYGLGDHLNADHSFLDTRPSIETTVTINTTLSQSKLHADAAELNSPCSPIEVLLDDSFSRPSPPAPASPSKCLGTVSGAIIQAFRSAEQSSSTHLSPPRSHHRVGLPFKSSMEDVGPSRSTRYFAQTPTESSSGLPRPSKQRASFVRSRSVADIADEVGLEKKDTPLDMSNNDSGISLSGNETPDPSLRETDPNSVPSTHGGMELDEELGFSYNVTPPHSFQMTPRSRIGTSPLRFMSSSARLRGSASPLTTPRRSRVSFPAESPSGKTSSHLMDNHPTPSFWALFCCVGKEVK